MRIPFASVAVAMAIAANPVQASEVDIDTLYTKAPSSIYLSSVVGRSAWTSQGFTPGRTGVLDRLDLQISKVAADDLRVVIGKGEVIDSDYAVLLTRVVPVADISSIAGDLVSLDLSGDGLVLKAGSLYSITLSAAAAGVGQSFSWTIGERTADNVEITLPPYDGGRVLGSFDSGATWNPRGSDRTFRTWMSAVPEPATWAFMLTGFGLVGMAVRRRPAAA